eukprot:TRINITY_DN7827_c0_g1_i1.p1 TRINITY_DN7827_c0_g1~~TRINITY_DN7827_c0_g1_i1.p1  ORF type:complete len:154 (-),score=28.07 TRINITY_DN7827_c0_g1_i1:111-572(-)
MNYVETTANDSATVEQAFMSLIVIIKNLLSGPEIKQMQEIRRNLKQKNELLLTISTQMAILQNSSDAKKVSQLQLKIDASKDKDFVVGKDMETLMSDRDVVVEQISMLNIELRGASERSRKDSSEARQNNTEVKVNLTAPRSSVPEKKTRCAC